MPLFVLLSLLGFARIPRDDGPAAAAVPTPLADAGAVPSSPTRNLRGASANARQFEVRFSADQLEKTDRYRFHIPSVPGMERATVQIVVECDHRLSYAHTYTNVDLGAADFSFDAPLTGEAAAAYWRPLEHPGLWSDWERGLLRRMEVKIFSPSPFTAPVACLYEDVPSDGGESVRLAWTTPLANPIPLGDRFELAFDLA